MPEHIARISHGKDSLKMLDVIVTRGLRLDRITTTDIWATDTIRGEHPEMVKFKDLADEYIWRKYRIQVDHLCAMHDGEKITYEKMFYHVPERKDANSEFDGLPRGFPFQKGSWCQKLKHQWVPDIASEKNIVEYLGIAADEPDRISQLSERKCAPLVEFGIEEGLCGLFCQYNDMLLPSYETSCRDGCWFCHNQGVDSLRNLWRNYPDHWALLLKWDKDSPVTFKADGHTVHDFDRRFQMEVERKIPTDRTFRWAMLDEPPKFVATEGEQLSLFERRKR